MSEPLDALDLKILTELQSDASLRLEALAERVGSSKSVCWRRIQRFKEEGIVTNSVTLLDAEKVGFGVMVLAMVKIDGRGEVTASQIIENIRKIPQVVECHALMGAVDLLLKIVAPTIKDYEKLLWERFSSMPGIVDIRSSISLTRLIDTTQLPLQILAKRR
ncbi:Lrp/AsnC family transcriptional regulator [Steroidobacter flavus]|uniref:Lrp/AsnC family transcriptional regulator n=1 Tax=Steroidobacter flavus TaxID=1842136 RepID=A0ABV8SLN5_9GAMM